MILQDSYLAELSVLSLLATKIVKVEVAWLFDFKNLDTRIMQFSN